MEDPPGNVEASYHYTPHSHRELNSVFLEWAAARTDADKKHVLDEAGMTIEELGEHFEIDHFGMADPLDN
jgi:hypothetical protein